MKIVFSYTRLPKPRGRSLYAYSVAFTLRMQTEATHADRHWVCDPVRVPLASADAEKWRRGVPSPLFVEKSCLALRVPFPPLREAEFSARSAAERERFIAAVHALVAELRARWIAYWRTHPPHPGDRAANVFAVRLPSPAEIYWSAEAERRAAAAGSIRRYALDEPSPGCPEAV